MAFIIVDDDELILHALKELFEVFAVPFDAFSDPEEAMLKFTKNPNHYSGAVLDYNLGYTTGIALADKMKALNQDIQFLFCTATNDLYNRNLIEERGMWLAKPLNAHTAFALIRYFIEADNGKDYSPRQVWEQLKEAQQVCKEAIKLIPQIREELNNASYEKQLQNLLENIEAISKLQSPPHHSIYENNTHIVK
ncbi:MAG: response regulator [Gammaproteobacteria bacterium]|nr:response regulator [Gammaproteobacteria bacterium]